MRTSTLAVAVLLLLPATALANHTVNPDRLDGTFTLVDKDQGTNNQLDFTVEGTENSATGTVTGNAGTDVVVITYETIFPDKFSANDRGAAVSQGNQVHVTLQFFPGLGNPEPPYTGQAAPNQCKMSAKIRDNEINDPDDPDKSQARLRCDLGRGLSRLDDDDVPATPGDPSQAVLDAVEAAFAARKDVKVRTSTGLLQIKHDGEAP